MRSAASILASVKEQEARFERLTRALEEERHNVSVQLERSNLPADVLGGGNGMGSHPLPWQQVVMQVNKASRILHPAFSIQPPTSNLQPPTSNLRAPNPIPGRTRVCVCRSAGVLHPPPARSPYLILPCLAFPLPPSPPTRPISVLLGHSLSWVNDWRHCMVRLGIHS